ncbi:MAG: hypothetical protein WBE71_11055 [Xanthobacteraceae bacterium]
MKSLKIKLALGAIAVAMLATPAFAQRPHQRVQNELLQTQGYVGDEAYQYGPALHYPDFSAGRTGTLESEESGAAFSLGR